MPLFLALAVTGACGLCACAATVHPDDMSAAAHRKEAERQRRIADDERASYEQSRQDSAAQQTAVPGGYVAPTFNSLGEWHLTRSAEARDLARRHRVAADQLEQFTRKECLGVSPEEQRSCPLVGPLSRVSELPKGVRLELVEGVDAAALATQMRCHQAFAQEMGFPAELECLFYLKGVTVSVSDDGRAIELRTRDNRTAREIRRRSSALLARR